MAYQVSAKEVAALRNRTGAGMMDCRNALVETSGDMEKEVDLLRQRGITKGEKRAGRGASEGLLYSYVHFNGKIAVLVEVNCETDFVARTEDFLTLGYDIASLDASTNTMCVSMSQDR